LAAIFAADQLRSPPSVLCPRPPPGWPGFNCLSATASPNTHFPLSGLQADHHSTEFSPHLRRAPPAPPQLVPRPLGWLCAAGAGSRVLTFVLLLRHCSASHFRSSVAKYGRRLGMDHLPPDICSARPSAFSHVQALHALQGSGRPLPLLTRHANRACLFSPSQAYSPLGRNLHLTFTALSPAPVEALLRLIEFLPILCR